MDWDKAFPKAEVPTLPQITAFIASPLWDALCAHIQESYALRPLIEHSTCSGAPGWNVKYKKSGRSLCVLYPHSGYFTCLVTVGGAVANDVELLLATFSPALQELFTGAKPFNGSRWLMIDVKTMDVLEDVKRLFALRIQHKR